MFDEVSLSSSDDDGIPKSVASRDEIKEVQRLSRTDTLRVRVLRIVVMLVILAAAVVVTVRTHGVLEEAEDRIFEDSFTKFAEAIRVSVLLQQARVLNSMQAYSQIVTSSALATNQSWPQVRVPFFEANGAHHVREEGRMPIVGVVIHVQEDEMGGYLDFVTNNYEAWLEESHSFLGTQYRNTGYKPYPTKRLYANNGTTDFELVPDLFPEDEQWMAFQTSPPFPTAEIINWNVASFVDSQSLFPPQNNVTVSGFRVFDNPGPNSYVAAPIHRELDPDTEIVALAMAEMTWDAVFVDILPKDTPNILVQLANTCGQHYNFQISGPTAVLIDDEQLQEPFPSLTQDVDILESSVCSYSIKILATRDFYDEFHTDTARIFAIVAITTFCTMVGVFLIYDNFVQRRNEKIVANAARSNAIVSSLFPGNIRDRLIANETAELSNPRSHNLKSFMADADAGLTDNITSDSKPLADLFLETSIIFADIVGFTAWSSAREPTQVFTLLETVYGSFDEIARRRGIFKVETVGDCYVAASGLPEPRRDHAIAMVRFARDILYNMQVVTRELEVSLGPDTAELSLRIGIHSGTVTAGVLRGERARFQLFGDTMNTTSRMESTGMAGRIHVSQETADLLVSAGKEGWLEQRKDVVYAKGKGSLTTYWISGGALGGGGTNRLSGEASISSDLSHAVLDADDVSKAGRLADWAVSTLLSLLRQVVARREAEALAGKLDEADEADDFEKSSLTMPLEEVKEIIQLPAFDPNVARQQRSPDECVISDKVVKQLERFVGSIAMTYRENDFHNFQHACHVTMSVNKLLSRIVAPELDLEDDELDANGHKKASTLHDHTYGITSDPLTQFACALSALIHDADHTGVPNTRLIEEDPELSARFNNRSVAEQNSLQLSWDLLMNPEFVELRKTICATECETRRFRELIINCVMATDIADKELKNLRNQRWDKAFTDKEAEEELDEDVNRKATIVIEHLIQASDVSHTMQHWNIYRRWNEFFFYECYAAFKDGRADKDPSEYWYKGEIGFFDFYIIPLAKKLKECGVFGKSSDEYLNYATQNRKEWESKGQEVVAQMMENVLRAEKESESQQQESWCPPVEH